MQEPIPSEQLTKFAQLLDEELVELNQAIDDTPIKEKDKRKTKRRKLKKDLLKWTVQGWLQPSNCHWKPVYPAL